MRAAHAEEAAAVRIGVEIEDGFLLQLVAMGLDPFGAAKQALFFAVPAGIDDGAAGLPALLEESREAAQFLHLGDQAGERIRGAVDPAVAVVAADDPLIGQVGAGNPDDHVVERDPIPVERQFEVDPGRSGAGPIGDREPAAPRRRNHIAA